jgi:hypothetical protein
VKFRYQKGLQNVNRWIKIVIPSLILSIVGAGGARADVTVDVSLELTVTSQITLAFNGLEMQVTAASGSPLFLDPTQQSTSFLTNANYVFSGQSFDAVNSLPYWTNFNPDITPNASQIVGGDSTADFLNVTLGPGTYLLAEVAYDLPSNASGPILVLPVNDPGATYFQDEDSSPYSYSYGFNTDTNTGTFVINTTAVPEPSSSTIVLISASLGGLLWYRRHRKASRTAKN